MNHALAGSGKKYKKCCINQEKEILDIRSALNEKFSSMTNEEIMYDMLTSFQRFLLEKKPHIKEYKKIRKIHGEITDSMATYYEDGKFQLEITNYTPRPDMKTEDILVFDSYFDMTTQVGAQGMMNMVLYKNSDTTKCITEKYLEMNRYKKPEKIKFLNSMLNSKAGLFEVTKTETTEGYVYLKDMLSGEEIKITDIALSGSMSFENFYSYMRIITYNGVSFGTGLNLIFKKEDPFIQNWIKKNKEKYNPKEETLRFIELYNRYSKDDNGVRVKMNRF